MQAGEVQNGVTRLKEENHPRIKEDTANRLKIQEILSTRIDVFDDMSHSSSSLENIFTGKVVDDKTVKVDNAVSIGT